MTRTSMTRAAQKDAADRAAAFTRLQERLVDLAATVLTAQSHQSAIADKYAAKIDRLQRQRDDESRQWRLEAASALSDMAELCPKGELATRTGMTASAINDELKWLADHDTVTDSEESAETGSAAEPSQDVVADETGSPS